MRYVDHIVHCYSLGASGGDGDGGVRFFAAATLVNIVLFVVVVVVVDVVDKKVPTLRG